ncbi:hypothetical protein BJY01DRAFT_256468, partial [Aspergillus pseudoustus]
MRRLTKHLFPEGGRKRQEKRELDEASQLVQRRYRQGALYFDISRPTKSDPYIRAQAHRYIDGEDGKRIADLSEDEKGFVGAAHASFQLYYKKYFFTSGHGKSLDEKPEARVFTEIESDPRFLHVHPGTITVEGFGRECWNYEQAVNNPIRPEITANTPAARFDFSRLPKRMVELEDKELRRIGLNRAQDDRDVMEW